MRNLMLKLMAAIMVLFAVSSASAQNGFLLRRSIGTGRRQIFANDGKGNLTLNVCSNVVNGVCVGGQVQGPATGEGGFSGINGFYTITGGGVTATLLSPSNCTTCVWALSGPSLNFALGTNPGSSNLLTGTFQLQNMTQTRNVNGSGFNQGAQGSFTVTGGVLEPYFEGNGVIKLHLAFTTDKPLQRIPKGQSLFQRFFGTVIFQFTPEP
jgi:hypothetical protein